MLYCYPSLSVTEKAWRVECGWNWNTFGVILCVSTDNFPFVLRLGWAYVMVWHG